MRSRKQPAGRVLAVALLALACGRAADSSSGRPAANGQAETVTDFDGNVYRTVRIGAQVWMAENLRGTHYGDGAPVPSFVYNNDTANARVYGRLYRWQAAMNGAPSSAANPSGVQGACPRGWHVPSNAEWQQMFAHLGGESVAGGKLKEAGAVHWGGRDSATNESGFGALPTGWFDFTRDFRGLGGGSFIRSATAESAGEVEAVELGRGSASVSLVHVHPDDALPVRCVRNP